MRRKTKQFRFVSKMFWCLALTLFLIACGQNIDQVTKPNVSNNSNLEVSDGDKKDSEETKQEDEARPTNTEPLAELKVHYIDVGQADATLFQYTDNDKRYTILFDAGDWNKNDVVHYLTDQNVTYIDLIVISHPHADHIGQLAEVMKNFEVGEVWMSGNTTNSRTFEDAVEAVLSSDADYYEPRTGAEFDIGPMEIKVLHPSSLTEGLNEDSISLRFTYGDFSFLFTGDAYKKQELIMVNHGDVQADFLQMGHHGSNTSNDPAFIKAVNPKVAIYSAGENNSYGHPHDEVISRIQDAGIIIYGTNVHGTIVVTTDGKNYDITTKKDGAITTESTPESKPKENTDQQNNTKKELTSSNCVDINSASQEELQQIIHIGPERAEDVIKEREQKPFISVDGLTKIKGIGPARIADIKTEGLACVGG